MIDTASFMRRSPGEKATNSSGAPTFQISDSQRFERFLITGVDGGSYYATERELTLDNSKVIKRLAGGATTKKYALRRAGSVSYDGLAPKQDPALFAIAALLSTESNVGIGDEAKDAFSRAVRTGTHLFKFALYATKMRGWGRLMRECVSSWYESKTPSELEYQLVKYQSRYGWSHKDLIRLSHPKLNGEKSDLAKWLFGKSKIDSYLFPKIAAMESIHSISSSSGIIDLATANDLPWEAVPTGILRNPDYWRKTIPTMGAEALMRNLGRFANIGMVGNEDISLIVNAINSKKTSRGYLHPFTVYVARHMYNRGSGDLGGMTWRPNQHVSRALEELFYARFPFVESTGKSISINIDVSGSMTWNQAGSIPGLTAARAAAVMALVYARTEPNVGMYAFSTEITPIKYRREMSLDDMYHLINSIGMGATNCAAPMQYAEKFSLPYDAFVVLTDNETNSGAETPAVAIRRYRENVVRDSKLITVAFTSTAFSIADPSDVNMLDLVGFDTSGPSVMNAMLRGF